MDAYEIARLMANQDPSNPLRLRFGVVASVGEGTELAVVPDGEAVAVPAVRCCRPAVGNRVVIVADASEWLAVAAVGGDHVDTGPLDALETRIDALQATANALQAQANTLQTRVDTLQGAVDALASDTGWTNIYHTSNSSGSIDIKARRVGNVVTVAGVSAGYYDIGNSVYHDVTRLSEVFRPNHDIPFVVNFMGGTPSGQSAYVHPDGLISMYATGTRDYWCFNVTYVV